MDSTFRIGYGICAIYTFALCIHLYIYCYIVYIQRKKETAPFSQSWFNQSYFVFTVVSLWVCNIFEPSPVSDFFSLNTAQIYIYTHLFTPLYASPDLVAANICRNLLLVMVKRLWPEDDPMQLYIPNVFLQDISSINPFKTEQSKDNRKPSIIF